MIMLDRHRAGKKKTFLLGMSAIRMAVISASAPRG
jgi:hypothetical protein